MFENKQPTASMAGEAKKPKHLKIEDAVTALGHVCDEFEDFANSVEGLKRSEVVTEDNPEPSLAEVLNTTPEKVSHSVERIRDTIARLRVLLF